MQGNVSTLAESGQGKTISTKNELISQRTKEALARLKSERKKLGRPKGSGKIRLDPHLG